MSNGIGQSSFFNINNYGFNIDHILRGNVTGTGNGLNAPAPAFAAPFDGFAANPNLTANGLRDTSRLHIPQLPRERSHWSCPILPPVID